MDEILQEIIKIIKETTDVTVLHDLLFSYHSNDIARCFEYLDDEDLEKVYKTFDEQELAEIFTYLDDVKEYIEDLNKEDKEEQPKLLKG